MTRPREIVFCSDILPGCTFGGRESWLLQIAPLLTSAGARLRLATLRREETPTLLAGGIEVCTVARAAVSDEQKKRSVLNGVILVLGTAWWLLWNKADLVEFDQIPHAAFPLGLVSCWLTGKRAIIKWHEPWTRNGWCRYLGQVVGRLAFLGEDISLASVRAIANSEFTANGLRSVHHAPAKEISVVPMFVQDTSLSGESRPYHLGFVGRILPHKRVDLFLRLVAAVKTEIPHVRAAVIGDGDDLDFAKSLAAQLGLEAAVTFLGELDAHADVLSAIGTMELLVVCSEREGFGLVVLEANARGVPVLVRAGAGNGAAELVTDGVNGYVCDGDSEMIRRAVEYLGRPSGSARLRSGAIEVARGYSVGSVGPKVLGAYGLGAGSLHARSTYVLPRSRAGNRDKTALSRGADAA